MFARLERLLNKSIPLVFCSSFSQNLQALCTSNSYSVYTCVNFFKFNPKGVFLTRKL